MDKAVAKQRQHESWTMVAPGWGKLRSADADLGGAGDRAHD